MMHVMNGRDPELDHVWWNADRCAIYLAGKVARFDDWRAEIVRYESDSGEHREGGIVGEDDYGRRQAPWPVREHAIFGRYDYTGPYVTDCGHGENNFGTCYEDVRASVVQDALDAIRRSDLVFAWMDRLSAYGTLAEIGYAKALGKKVWIAGPMSYDDLWFTYHLADRLTFGVSDPRLCLLAMLGHIPRPIIDFEVDIRPIEEEDEGTPWQQ
jgi:hypothetical protein